MYTSGLTNTAMLLRESTDRRFGQLPAGGWNPTDRPIHSYRDLRVWQAGMALAKACYLTTRSFPRCEQFGLTSQIRRAATSVPANIAEGYGRESTGEYVQFLRVAQGSLKELETYLMIARDVDVSQPHEVADLLERADQLGRMLRSLIRKLQAKRAEVGKRKSGIGSRE